MNWFKQLFSRRRRYDELSETIREHLDEKIADLMDRGMTPEQAEHAARREFGNATLIEQRSREVWQWTRLESVWTDIRHTLRKLWKSPGFTATTVLMLAFSIGVTTAIFSIVNGVLLQPLHFPDPNGLVTLGDLVNGFGWTPPGFVTAPEVMAYSRNTHSFQSLGGYSNVKFALSGVGQPTQIQAGRMMPSVFYVLGIAPLMGRVFTPEEDRQKAHVAVLSYAAWKSRFNGNPQIIGTTIDLDRESYIVIGVMPKNFEFPFGKGSQSLCELWVPTSFSAQDLSPEGGGESWDLRMIGRLKPGVTVAQAQNDAQQVAAQTMRTLPPDLSNIRIQSVVFPLHTVTVADARPLLRLLFFAVVVVMLIACANLAGLLLVRALRRQREMAVRLALGSSASTLLRQTMLESLVISVTGGLLGIGLADLAISVVRAFLPSTLPLTSEIALNWTVVGFGLLLALLTGALCGLAPGLAALRTNVNTSLKEGGRSDSGRGAHARLRSALVVAEIAIALVLLCAAGLLLRSYRKVIDVDYGFHPDHVTTAAYALPQKKYLTQSRIDAFNNQMLLRLSQLPGVQSVGLTDSLPIIGVQGLFVPDGYVDPRGPGKTSALNADVIGDFFKATGIPLIKGRYFTDSDNANGQLVVIVSRQLAERYWPNQDPIGKRLRLGTLSSKTPWLTVVGEVAGAKLNRFNENGFSQQFYLPVAQDERDDGSYATPTDLNGNSGYIVVRSSLPPKQMENALRVIVRAIDPQLPLTQVQTMEEIVAQSTAPRRFNAAIISSFALAAVFLAVLGIYSIIAFSVASRVHEMAIRMALGSQRLGIVRLVFRSGMKLALIGCVMGLGGSVAVSGLLRSFLFGISPFDPLVMALAAASVFLLAIVASVIPARRAASIDPMQALRSE